VRIGGQIPYNCEEIMESRLEDSCELEKSSLKERAEEIKMKYNYKFHFRSYPDNFMSLTGDITTMYFERKN
jgi:hypothetical protein